MKLIIDTESATVQLGEQDDLRQLPLYGTEAFELLSELWLKVGWAQRYSYTFTWLGRPIIQLPEDVLRIQEAIFSLKPDIVIETGIARGGSLVLYASLLELLGNGRVIGVDIEIRPHNREAIEAHPLAPRITMIESSSTDPAVVGAIAEQVTETDRVLVILDSNHSREHVRDELRAYAGIVSVGSYMVATDGIMHILEAVPGGQPGWDRDNPMQAARDFVAENQDFAIEDPPLLFNDGGIESRVTYWPGAYVKRLR